KFRLGPTRNSALYRQPARREPGEPRDVSLRILRFRNPLLCPKTYAWVLTFPCPLEYKSAAIRVAFFD
ncbi:MAG TPA: hypothetical protein PLY87_31610, partial [Planctomycetaceae bacterium]|nr:hypothetical protein [Planctomycetaceae bacterium]